MTPSLVRTTSTPTVPRLRLPSFQRLGGFLGVDRSDGPYKNLSVKPKVWFTQEPVGGELNLQCMPFTLHGTDILSQLLPSKGRLVQEQILVRRRKPILQYTRRPPGEIQYGLLHLCVPLETPVRLPLFGIRSILNTLTLETIGVLLETRTRV